MTIRLDRIATRGGDRGETSLADGRRLRKDALRIEVFGELDEANAAIGLLRTACADAPDIDGVLARIQNELFDCGASLSRTAAPEEDAHAAAYLERLDADLARFNERLSPLTSFVLPGGSESAARAHLARTVTRRAERTLVALAQAEQVPAFVIPYLNRLSDLLFVLARALNENGAKDVLWRPGGKGSASSA
jgi:cob(I)alamin adenosyltransferase